MNEDIFKGLKPAKKAYTFNWYYVKNSYLYDQNQYIAYAESSNKAKVGLLKMARYMDVKFLLIDEPTYLNLPIRRYKEKDKYLIDGTLYTKEEYLIHLHGEKLKDQIDEILANDEIKYCFIKKNGSYYRELGMMVCH